MLQFFKYHGLGNDFVVVEASDVSERVLARVVDICDRHTGVGADGILVVDTERPSMIVLNNDGSRPEMCGNGIRCVARYLVEEKGHPDDILIHTDAGPRRCLVTRRQDEFWVDVDMGAGEIQGRHNIEAAGVSLGGLVAVSMGNPHAVFFGDVTPGQIDKAGEVLNDAHPVFPAGVNLEIVVVDPEVLDVVVYERGVGRTQACGTGACAVAVAAWSEGIRKRGPTAVRLPGGVLSIDWRNDHTWMCGPAEAVFQGKMSESWFESRETNEANDMEVEI